MDDNSSPASYIHMVQHLIETCICHNMNKEECMEALEKHAKINPVITSTVWNELEKENREFFETYKKRQGEESTPKSDPIEQTSTSTPKSDPTEQASTSTPKSPTEQASAFKSSDEGDNN